MEEKDVKNETEEGGKEGGREGGRRGGRRGEERRGETLSYTRLAFSNPIRWQMATVKTGIHDHLFHTVSDSMPYGGYLQKI